MPTLFTWSEWVHSSYRVDVDIGGKRVLYETTLVRNDGSTIISLCNVFVYNVHITVFPCIATWFLYETLFHTIIWMPWITSLASHSWHRMAPNQTLTFPSIPACSWPWDRVDSEATLRGAWPRHVNNSRCPGRLGALFTLHSPQNVF